VKKLRKSIKPRASGRELFPKCDIPHARHRPRRRESGHFFGFRGSRAMFGRVRSRGTGVVITLLPREEMMTMSALANPVFWNMKIKIAILTFATFAALC
jgi:hypothetical protein